MKKATLTIGLFTLVLATTSFASPKISTSSIADITEITPIDGTGAQDAGGHRKMDYNGNQTIKSSITKIAKIDGTGAQDAGGHRKMD